MHSSHAKGHTVKKSTAASKEKKPKLAYVSANECDTSTRFQSSVTEVVL